MPSIYRAQADGDSRDREFASLAELAASPDYAAFHYMSVGDPALPNLIDGHGEEVDAFPELPPALEVLRIEGMRVRALPALPPRMRELHVRMTLLAKLPACAACLRLHRISVTHSYISGVTAPLPVGLRTLDLAFNVLRSVDFGCVPILTNIITKGNPDHNPLHAPHDPNLF